MGGGVDQLGHTEILLNEALQVMPNGNLAGLATFVEESKAVLIAGIEKSPRRRLATAPTRAAV